MFGSKKGGEGMGTVIGKSTVLENCRVTGSESVYVKGRVIGSVEVFGEVIVSGEVTGGVTTGKAVTIEKGGKVTGGVRALSLTVIGGSEEGDVTVEEAVTVCKGGKLNGNITAESFDVEKGSSFVGNCNVMADTKTRGTVGKHQAVKGDKQSKKTLERNTDDKDKNNAGFANSGEYYAFGD